MQCQCVTIILVLLLTMGPYDSWAASDMHMYVPFTARNGSLSKSQTCYTAVDKDQSICPQSCTRNHNHNIYQLYVTNVAMKGPTVTDNVSTTKSLVLRVQPILPTDERKQQLVHQHHTGAALACIQSLTAVTTDEDYTICTHLNFEHDSLDHGATLEYLLPALSDISNSSIHLLHLWVVAIDKEVGRITTSAVCCDETDVYLAIDLSLSGGGFDLHREAVGRHLHTDVCVIAAAPFPLPDARGCAVMNMTNVDLSPSSTSNDMKEHIPCPCVLCERAFGPTIFQTTDPILLANQEVCASRTPQTVNEPLTHPSSLQRVTADFCAQHRLTHVACGYLAAHLSSVVYKDILASTLGLPAVQHMPTPQDPFVFLHIEKTAGSALRTFAEKSAQRLGLGSFLPCYGALDCGTFNVINSSLARAQANLSGIAIVGGHFSWNIWRELPSYQFAHGNNTNNIIVGKENESKVLDSCTVIATATDNQSDSDPSNRSCVSSSSTAAINPNVNPSLPASPNSSPSLDLSPNPDSTSNHSTSNPGLGLSTIPPCFVAARHPVARVVSYYYQRCYDTYGCVGYQRYINDLSVDELRGLVANYRHVGAADPVKDEFAMVLDDGMNDASCRSLQSIEPSMRGMSVAIGGRGNMTVHVPPPPAPLSPMAVQAALNNVERCVVAITESWQDSAESLLRQWFPWLLFEDYTILRTEILIGEGGNKAAFLRDELVQVVLEHNPCDIALYNKMIQLHDKQMNVVMATAYLPFSKRSLS